MMVREPRVEGRPVWAEVSLGALRHNLRAIRRHIGGKRQVLAIVKANAYGHGAVEVAKALESSSAPADRNAAERNRRGAPGDRGGADWFGVTCTDEGAELREAGIRKPILVLTGFWLGEEEPLLRYKLTPAITQLEQLRYLEAAAAKHLSSHSRKAPRPKTPTTANPRVVDFHLKVDTGMNRLGLPSAEIERFARALADCPHLHHAGTFTHFASAEDFTSDQTGQQERVFADALARLRAAGCDPGLVHLANSAGIAARPSTWADMVRPGALLYGYHQFYDPPEKKAEMEALLPLRPALSLRARIILLRDVPAGRGVGYNARFVAPRDSRIAVIAAGYADGLVRRRSSGEPGTSTRSRVIVRPSASPRASARCAPLVGLISMDLAMVDVTDVPGVRVGDVCTIYGKDGCAIYASDVARELGTVTSDLLCAIGTRVPRFYVE